MEWWKLLAALAPLAIPLSGGGPDGVIVRSAKTVAEMLRTLPRGAPLDEEQLQALRCRCCGTSGMDAALLARLGELQARWKKRLTFTSGRRCARHNARVGGVPYSRHLTGQAADVAIAAREQPRFCALARRLGFRSVLPCQQRNYVHLSL